MKEIIIICIGQCGVQIGTKLWEILYKEHKHPENKNYLNNSILFSQSNKNKLIARTIFIDSDFSTVDRARNKFKELGSSNFHSGKESCCDSYARGGYTTGKMLLWDVIGKIKRIAENAENLSGFLLIHSCQGGTGAGFAPLLLHELKKDYRKKELIEAVVVPSPDMINGPLEIFNFGGYLYQKNDIGNIELWFNNQGIYRAMERHGITNPNFEQVNEVIASSLSSFLLGPRETQSLEFRNFSGHSSLESIIQNLIPYPPIKYISPSISPLISRDQLYSSPVLQNDEVVPALFANSLIVCDYRKSKTKLENKICASFLIERGNDNFQDIHYIRKQIWESELYKICSFSEERMKASRYATRSFALEVGSGNPNSGMISRMHSSFMNSNSVQSLVKLCGDKFTKQYSRRAFVHWLVGEGLESGEMSGCNEQFHYIVRNYDDCFSESISVESDFDDY
jgi:tubulin alpha